MESAVSSIEGTAGGSETELIRSELQTIAAALDQGSYQPGAWRRVTERIRRLPQADRLALAPDVSAVSRRLHSRRYQRTLGVPGALLMEAWLAIFGGFLIAAGIAHSSNLRAILGMLLWVSTFEPLLKVAVGTALGVTYDYAYLYGGLEPRFKMNYGSYLAMAPLARVLLQFSGMLGSLIGAALAGHLTFYVLPTAHAVSWIAFWVLLAINLGQLIAGFLGIERLGGMRLPPGSSTTLVTEWRWWRQKDSAAAPT
ncbi:MAG TPA: hypothetical protein VFB15_00850 [Candidatus Binataceae bacterium]|nr:hypothetical protein [Candidatus Binataceae bacterium]